MGNPRTTTSYKACVNVLLSSKKLHHRPLRSMVDTHREYSVFARCTHRSAKEATMNYIVLEDDFELIRDKLAGLAIKTA